MPAVTVILPLFNHASTCSAAIRSILAQTLADLELVVVDDGSTDASAQAAVCAAAGDPRMTLVSIPHGGIVPAINAGLARAAARLIARMDADDVAAPARLELQLAHLRSHPAAGAVDCRVILAPSAATRDGMRRHVEWMNSLLTWHDIRCNLLVESPLVHPAVTMRREALDDAGGYLDCPGPEDYSLWLRMAAAGWELHKLKGTLLTWSDPPGRLTRTHPRYTQEQHLRLKVEHLPSLVPAVRRGYQLWGAGRTGRRFARAMEAVHGLAPLRCFDVDPARVGTRLGRAAVLPLADLPRHADTLTLIAVGSRLAKRVIAAWLEEQRWIPFAQHLFVA